MFRASFSLHLFNRYGINPSGKACVVLGRSNIVGMPMVCLLQSMNGTVTCCHSRTPNIPEIVRSVRRELLEEVVVEMPEIRPAKDLCKEFA